MGFRYLPAAWDTDVPALLAHHGPGPGRAVGAASLKLLLLNVAEHANNESGRFFAGTDTVARETNLDARTVRAGLAKLVHFGLLELIEESHQHFPAVYQLQLLRAGDAPALDSERAICHTPSDRASRPPDRANGQARVGVSPVRVGDMAPRVGDSPPDPVEPGSTRSENPKEPGAAAGSGLRLVGQEPESETLPFEPSLGERLATEFGRPLDDIAEGLETIRRAGTSKPKRIDGPRLEKFLHDYGQDHRTTRTEVFDWIVDYAGKGGVVTARDPRLTIGNWLDRDRKRGMGPFTPPARDGRRNRQPVTAGTAPRSLGE